MFWPPVDELGDHRVLHQASGLLELRRQLGADLDLLFERHEIGEQAQILPVISRLPMFSKSPCLRAATAVDPTQSMTAAPVPGLFQTTVS